MMQYTNLERQIAFDVSLGFPLRPAPFVNREQEIAKVLRYLDPIAAPRGILISGEGGVGKTTVATEAAWRAWERAHYDELLFLTAKVAFWDFEEKNALITHRRGKHQFATFSGMLGKLGIILGLPRSRADSKGEEAKLERLRAGLKDRRILLVIDNLDAITSPKPETGKFENLVNFYLPPGNKAIITSRGKLSGMLGKGLVEIELDRFDDTVAEDLLMALSTYLEVNVPLRDVPRLSSASQGNPLIMEQIFTIFAKHGVEMAVTELKALEPRKLLPFLFDLSFRQLGPKSRNVLFAIALATFPTTKHFLEAVPNLTPPKIEDSIAELDRWSLLVKSNGEFDVHHLLEKYVVNLLKRQKSVWERWMQRVQAVEAKFWAEELQN